MKAYIVRLVFESIEPEIWRRVILPAGATFNRLHEIIQRTTNFQSYYIDEPYHFYDVEIDDVLVANNPHMHEEFGKSGLAGRTLKKPTRLKIDELLEKEKTMIYNYDSGDGWRIKVDLEEVVDDYHFGFPILLAGGGTAPPEDVGGPPGYASFLKTYHDPGHPEYAHMREWAESQTYREFDPESINSWLKDSKYQKTEWDKIDHVNHRVKSDKYFPVEGVPSVAATELASSTEPVRTASKPKPIAKITLADNEVLDYIKACTHLYGVVTHNKVVEIYNGHHAEKVTLKTLKTLIASKEVKAELYKAFVDVQRNDFVHESVELFEEKKMLLEEATGKPYYVPAKEELLRYMDDEYIESTPAQVQLSKMLKRDFGAEIDIEEEVWDLAASLQVSGGDFTPILTNFLERLELTTVKAQQYIAIIINMANTTRLWENCGHTPNELSAYGRKSESPVDKVMVTVKTGRNDLCPCGSGKKYKKCCGK